MRVSLRPSRAGILSLGTVDVLDHITLVREAVQ